MISCESVTKRYGARVALDGAAVDVLPGRVTGLLGPNGAGKTTLMRVVLGLAAASAGRATVCGRPYREWPHPARVLGAHLDVRAAHPGRRARAHLRACAHASGLPARRADEVLEEVGLSAVARRRAGTFSLGMAQRLGIAAALLGEPEVLVLDEPVNGLDSEGVRWVRDLLRRHADAGGTVLLSSHLMSETELTADHVVVMGRGRVLADRPIAAFTARGRVRVRGRDRRATAVLATAMDRAGWSHRAADGDLEVEGVPVEQVGDVAAAAGVGLHRLEPVAGDLESAYRALVAGEQEFAGVRRG